MKEKKKIFNGNEKQAEEYNKVFATGKVKNSAEPHFNIDIPVDIAILLGLKIDDNIDFIEENGKIYIEKA